MKAIYYTLIFFVYFFIGFVIGKKLWAEELHLNSLNTVTFRGEVNNTSVTTTSLNLAKAVGTRGSKPYPIYLVMDSPGGSISSGLSFIDFAKTVPNLRTVTFFAASMASAIVEQLPGLRLITPNGVLMFHRAAGSMSGQFETGELESQLELAKTMVRGMEIKNAARLQITLTEYKQKVINQYWLLPDQALQDKAADKKIDVVCSQELVDRREVSVDCSMFGCTDATYSACPAIRYPVSTKEQ